MGKQPVNEQMIIEYLLGGASDSEQERLDEMSVTDDEFAELLRASENDLIDSYVRGELSGDVLTKFNTYYLASSGRREKVSFAKTFLRFADKSVGAQMEDARAVALSSHAEREPGFHESSRWRFLALLRPTLQWGLATAALVILIGGGYLVVENQRLRNRMAQTQAERAALEQREQELRLKLDQQRSLDNETEKELEQVRDRLTQLEQQLAAGQQQTKPEPEPRGLKVIAFNLTPQSRGIGQITTLTLPAGTDYLSLILEMEVDGFPAYQAALRNPANGQIVWRSGKLKVSGKEKSLRVSLPGSLLNSQNYVLELSGITTKGVADNVSSYAFRVVNQ